MNDTFCPYHVVDVEFRRLERTEKSVCEGGCEVGRKVTVLQSRKLWREADPIDASVSDCKAQRWSDWGDVPTVSE